MSLLRGRSSSLHEVAEEIAIREENTLEEREGVTIPRRLSTYGTSFGFHTFHSHSDFVGSPRSPTQPFGSVASLPPLIIEQGLPITSSAITESFHLNQETEPLLGRVVEERDAPGAWKETKRILSMSIPVAAAYLLSYFSQTTLIFFVGRLGASQLASASLGILFANVTGMSLIVGVATSMDTLMSQASSASNDPTILGKILQRGLLMTIVFSLPLLVIWWFSGNFLLLLRQPEEEARLAGEIIRYLMPGLIPFGISECLKRFCQAQGIMSASVFSVLITSILNVPLTWLLVWSKWNIGVLGAAISIDFMNVLNVLLLLFYIRFINGSQAWGGFSKDAISGGWKSVLKLAASSLFQVASEWWAFEISSLMCGILPTATIALAGQSILLTLISLSFMIPLGISVTSSLRVGANLGSQQPEQAKMSARIAVCLAFLIGLVNMVIFLLLRNHLARIFTNDAKIIKIVSDVLPLVAVFQILDCLNGCCAGVIRGVGNQRVGAILSAVGYYVVGLPIGGYLAFSREMDLKGIWLGLCCGLIVVTVGQLWHLFGIDWVAASDKALDRITKAVPDSVDGCEQITSDSQQTQF
jgi:MATE family multidrug resistance protein